MHPQRNTYNPDKESDKTLQTMINNFNRWYDWDPTEEQANDFDKNRKETIKNNYEKSLNLRELENRTRELISSDAEIQKAIKDIEYYYKSEENEWIQHIEHLISVSKIISRNYQDKEMIESWLLHNLIRDTANWEIIKQKYSEEVYKLADSLSKQNKSSAQKEERDSYISNIDTYNYKSLTISISDVIQDLRNLIKLLEKDWNNTRNKLNIWMEDKKQFILSYSMKVKSKIDKIDNEKDHNNLLDYYNELSILIWYFLELIDKNKQ